MGLYLAIFDGNDELDGVEVGHYRDFKTFRDVVTKYLEGGKAGSKYSTLVSHSDSDGKWSPSDAAALEKELEGIAEGLRQLPPMPLQSDWQQQVAKTFRFQMNTLYDCFFDIDGEPLLERLINLTRLSQHRNLPILFQ